MKYFVLKYTNLLYSTFYLIWTVGVCLNSNKNNYSISIDKWCELSNSGEVMPIKIQLNGTSMQPLIRKNRDYVTIIPLRREPLIGDIIIFLDTKKRYCAHRIKRMRDNKIQTIGDNCYNHDPWISKDEIAGLIISMERNGKIYKLDSPFFRLLGKVRMAFLPIRKFNRPIIQFLWSVYIKVFRKNEGGNSSV